MLSQPRLVLPNLYIGSIHHAQSLPLLHSLGISDIFFVYTAKDNLSLIKVTFPQGFNYHHIDLQEINIDILQGKVKEICQACAWSDDASLMMVDCSVNQDTPLLTNYIVSLYAVQEYDWTFATAWSQVTERKVTAVPLELNHTAHMFEVFIHSQWRPNRSSSPLSAIVPTHSFKRGAEREEEEK